MRLKLSNFSTSYSNVSRQCYFLNAVINKQRCRNRGVLEPFKVLSMERYALVVKVYSTLVPIGIDSLFFFVRPLVTPLSVIAVLKRFDILCNQSGWTLVFVLGLNYMPDL